MKIKCCCFTCFICEDNDLNAASEDKPLIEENDDDLSQPPVLSQPRFDTQPSASSTSDYSFDKSEDASEKQKVTKAVGVLRRYNVMSKRYSEKKEFQRQLTSDPILTLKIAVKVMPRSDLIKVFVIEANNVLHILKSYDFPEATGSSDSESLPIMQIRSKITPSEVRGHTGKYEVNNGMTGSMKFRNECIHSLSVDEFHKSELRLRVYYVLKHHRDKLLGEYSLDLKTLEISFETGTTNIVMETYDPSVPNVQPTPPEIIPVNQHLFGNESQSSSESSSTNPRKISRQTALQSQDSSSGLLVKSPTHEVSSSEDQLTTVTEENQQSTKKRPMAKAFKSMRHGASHILKDSKEKLSSSRSTSQETPHSPHELSQSEKLRQAINERTEKLGRVDDATAAMANNAENFTNVAEKLRQKYQHSVEK